MAITKKRKAAAAKVDKNKFYTLKEASSLVKEEIEEHTSELQSP